MPTETKTVTIEDADSAAVELEIKRQLALGWETVSTSSIYEGTAVMLVLKRSNDIPYYRRKCQIEQNISQLRALADECFRKLFLKKESIIYGVLTLLLIIAATLSGIFALLAFVLLQPVWGIVYTMLGAAFYHRYLL